MTERDEQGFVKDIKVAIDAISKENKSSKEKVRELIELPFSVEDVLDVVNFVNQETSEEVDSGKVIRTEPTAGRKVKKGTKITLVESSGNYALVVEDYTDQNVYYIQGLLEASEIKVQIEKKDIDSSEKDKYEENKIMEQSVKVGEHLKAGDTIILYIPDIQETYPDFVEEAWSVEDVQTFCDEHNITLKIDKEENGDKAPGTILEQSRRAGSEVVSGSNLKIVVAEEPSNTPGEGEPEDGSTNITDDTNE
jgi:serine/threonine-protein kinase